MKKEIEQKTQNTHASTQNEQTNKVDEHQLVHKLYSMWLISLDLLLRKLSRIYNISRLTIHERNTTILHAASTHIKLMYDYMLKCASKVVLS